MPEGNSALFIHRTDSNRVLFLAIAAAPQEPLVALSGLGVLHLVNRDRPALHAAGSIAPALLLKELDGGKFIRACKWDFFNHIRLREVMSWPRFLHALNLILNASCVK